MTGSGGETGWERLFWLVFERTSNPVVLLDENRRIVRINDAGVSLLRRPRDQLLGTSLADKVLPSERPRSDEEWRAFLQDGEYSGTRDLVLDDGSEVQVNFAARLADVAGERRALYVMMVGSEPEIPPAPSAAQLALTNREREIVTLIALGKDTNEIAAELHVSPETVRSHVRNSMAKLDVHTRAQLVAVAMCAENALHMGAAMS
jgi:DNA-binding CsgD family transcriptional regulator